MNKSKDALFKLKILARLHFFCQFSFYLFKLKCLFPLLPSGHLFISQTKFDVILHVDWVQCPFLACFITSQRLRAFHLHILICFSYHTTVCRVHIIFM